MNAHTRITLLAAVALSILSTAAVAQKLYRWVDKDGVVHFGDRVPPEYANRDRDVLNDQGIAVGREEGELTDPERAALREEQRAEAAEQAAKAEVARRDRMLLETYLSVADIEDLRDRRLELLESQIQVTELYLANLRERLDSLHAEAARYKPYSDREDAPEVPADLAGDIAQTEGSIAIYEDTLTRSRQDQEKLRASFDSDIARFRELKGS